MARVIPLGGRFFAPAEQTTSRQDGWIMARLEDAGILELLVKGTLGDESTGRKLIVQAMASGHYEAVIAGLLVEDKEKWTFESATANAEFFATLTKPDDKKALAELFGGVLIAFFQHGGRSWTPSPIASPPSPTSNGHQPKKRARRSIATAAGSGPTAPGSSLTATPPA